MKNIFLSALLLCSLSGLTACIYDGPLYARRPPRPIAVERVDVYRPEPVIRERVYCQNGGWRRGNCY